MSHAPFFFFPPLALILLWSDLNSEILVGKHQIVNNQSVTLLNYSLGIFFPGCSRKRSSGPNLIGVHYYKKNSLILKRFSRGYVM